MMKVLGAVITILSAVVKVVTGILKLGRRLLENHWKPISFAIAVAVWYLKFNSLMYNLVLLGIWGLLHLCLYLFVKHSVIPEMNEAFIIEKDGVIAQVKRIEERRHSVRNPTVWLRFLTTLGYSYYWWRTTKLTLTPEEVFVQKGVFLQNEVRVNIGHVRYKEIDFGRTGRWTGAGVIILENAAKSTGSEIKFQAVDNPRGFINSLNTLLDELQQPQLFEAE